jgi:phosphonate transport system ATP-binding protein
MLLTIENLRMQYPKSDIPALQGVTLQLAKGERVAVLGQSGAGKSTLVRCLNRLVKPQEGRILWQGQDVLMMRPGELQCYRQKVGMVFQSYALVNRLDVYSNVMVGSFGRVPLWRPIFGLYAKEERELAITVLQRVGLAKKACSRADRLSGGQQQRVGIARALMQRPQLILGDEPVASLDPVTARSVLDLLVQISEQDQIAMLLNLHSVELARHFAGRIIGLSHGSVVYDGPAEGLTGDVLANIYPQ